MIRSLFRGISRLFRFARKKEDEGELISFVLLLRKERTLDEDIIKKHLQMLADEDNLEDNPAVAPGPFPGSHIAVLTSTHHFFVLNQAEPYMELGETAGGIENEELRALWWEHAAWMSVDVTVKRDNSAFRESVCYAARLAKTFLDDNCVMLCIPSMQRLVPNDNELREKLASDDPFGVASLKRDGAVIGTKTGDEEVNAAMEEARRRFPEFVQAFQRKTGDSPFLVKAKFEEDGLDPEHMWVLVEEVDDESVTGSLENKPNKLKQVRYNNRVTVPRERVSDWMYQEDDEMHGGFVERLLAKRAG